LCHAAQKVRQLLQGGDAACDDSLGFALAGDEDAGYLRWGLLEIVALLRQGRDECVVVKLLQRDNLV